MTQGIKQFTEVDKVTIWVLTDNYFDTLRQDSKISRRYRVAPGKSIHAEHGLDPVYVFGLNSIGLDGSSLKTFNRPLRLT